MGASASVASGDPLVSEEKVKKHLGVLYDEEAKNAFQQSRRGSTRARKTRLLSWAGKGSRKRLSERGFVFFTNLKQLKVCIKEIGEIADEHLSGERVRAIPWAGENDILKQNKDTLSDIFCLAEKAKNTCF